MHKDKRSHLAEYFFRLHRIKDHASHVVDLHVDFILSDIEVWRESQCIGSSMNYIDAKATERHLDSVHCCYHNLWIEFNLVKQACASHHNDDTFELTVH